MPAAKRPLRTASRSEASTAERRWVPRRSRSRSTPKLAHESDVYAQAAEQFEQAELAQLISLILTINAWNRIGVTTRLRPGS